MKKEPQLYLIDFGTAGGGEVGFADNASAIEFVDYKLNEWHSVTGSFLDSADDNFHRQMKGPWEDLRNNLVSYPIEIQLEHIKNTVLQKVNNRTLVSLDSADGQMLAYIGRTINSRAAYGAFIFRSRSGSNISLSHAELTGAILYTNYENGLKPDSLALSKAAHKAREDSINAINKSFQQKVETKSRNLVGEFESLVTNFKDFIDHSNKIFAESKETLSDLHMKSASELVGLTRTYEEHLKLEKPAKYWQDKSKLHAWRYRLLLVLLIVLVAILFYQSGNLHKGVIEYCKQSVEFVTDGLGKSLPPVEFANLVAKVRIFSLVSTSILIASLAIWAFRYIVRLMISNEHLKSDAETRAIMITTFLALINNEGKTTEKEREIMLTSVFAKPSDGIVKDDGAPNLVPGSLVGIKMPGQ